MIISSTEEAERIFGCLQFCKDPMLPCGLCPLATVQVSHAILGTNLQTVLHHRFIFVVVRVFLGELIL